MNLFVIFPNQLFYDETPKVIQGYREVIIVEEPMFFYDSEWRPIRPNKVKLAYMVACMKAFYGYLKQFHKNVKYIPYNKVNNVLKHDTIFSSWEPYDFELLQKYVGLKVIETQSPYFLMTPKQMLKFHMTKYTKDKQLSNASYYNFVKSEIQVLKNIKSFDEDNRLPLPKRIKIPKAKRFPLNTYYSEAITYIENHNLFSKHIGVTTNVLYYPITPNDALQRLKYFCKNSLVNFGSYQDAWVSGSGDFESSLLFHSNMSSAMNIGILSGRRVVAEIIKVSKVDAIPMNSVEGFLRQVLGWREYCGYLYKFHFKDLVEANNYNANKELPKQWYSGTTGFLVIDEEIKKAITYGYANHIVRLMVFLNWMVLTEINSSEIYKWFMEVVSIDAYPWVMLTNIQMMSHYWTKAMRKPYISTSSYIVKMSNYKKDGKWDKTWDALFYAFLNKHKSDLAGSAKIYLRNLAYFESLSDSEKKKMLGIAKSVLKTT